MQMQKIVIFVFFRSSMESLESSMYKVGKWRYLIQNALSLRLCLVTVALWGGTPCI